MMENWERQILIEVFKDEELDVFSIYKKRRLEEQRKKESVRYKIDLLKKRKHQIESLRNITRVLINVYGRENAIPYLKVMFASGKQEVMEEKDGKL